MDYNGMYRWTMIVNCVTMIHYCINRIDKADGRALFYVTSVMTVTRLVADILFRSSPFVYQHMLGFFVVLELMLLDYIIRKMQKFTTSPPVVVFFLSLCMLSADISYCMYFLSEELPAAGRSSSAVPGGPMEL